MTLSTIKYTDAGSTRDTLMQLYSATKGHTWSSECSQNWGSTQDVCNNWARVECSTSDEPQFRVTLQDCGLEGTLPSLADMEPPLSLSQQYNLVVLNLQSNNISGTLPTSFINGDAFALHTLKLGQTRSAVPCSPHTEFQWCHRISGTLQSLDTSFTCENTLTRSMLV